MSKEELIQFEGLVIEILPDARYRVHLDAGYRNRKRRSGRRRRSSASWSLTSKHSTAFCRLTVMLGSSG
jgi:hypothetical protein